MYVSSTMPLLQKVGPESSHYKYKGRKPSLGMIPQRWFLAYFLFCMYTWKGRREWDLGDLAHALARLMRALGSTYERRDYFSVLYLHKLLGTMETKCKSYHMFTN